ncbi:hypothetical protein [Pontibacter harenae]|uniref:hypothetical protein n=1 Tax=Pontibacter harenae TaxID=2894083 RepID=UPI001E547894|nr:hypothetical protein [Pontibacter harenae]MCC9167931.1 hypothetical protein [Pontibacter harenae]
MNTIMTPSAISCLTNTVLSISIQPFMVWQSYAAVEESSYDFSTIDGDVITYRDGAMAVDSGAGILIGDYFVGVAENYAPSESQAYILY